jgi:hypothetical protein
MMMASSTANWPLRLGAKVVRYQAQTATSLDDVNVFQLPTFPLQIINKQLT